MGLLDGRSGRTMSETIREGSKLVAEKGGLRIVKNGEHKPPWMTHDGFITHDY